jgi:hypothetical protein
MEAKGTIRVTATSNDRTVIFQRCLPRVFSGEALCFVDHLCGGARRSRLL